MNVLLINGSPHKRGTYTALEEAAASLEAEGIGTEIAGIGKDPVRGCIACGACAKNRDNRCTFDDDIVNRLLEKTEAADGIIVGTPVYYAGANGALIAALDRMFFAGGRTMRFKPAAGIACARRAGTTPAIDQINKYFHYNSMPVAGSTYWAMVHGQGADQVVQDAEGMQTVRMLAKNMAWLLKCIEAGEQAGIGTPELEPKVMTNFIR